MPYHKDIHLKINMVHIGQMTQYFQPSLLGSALMVMIALYHDDYDTVEKFMGRGSPLPNALIDRKWVEMNTRFLYELTPNGKQIVEFYLSKPPKKSKKKEESEEVKAVDDWIDEWLKIWPAKVKSMGKPIRSAKTAVLPKMKNFVQDYKYDKELIMAATKHYLYDRYNSGWQFTRLASNFIYRTEGKVKESDLASFCVAVLDKTPSFKATIKQL